MLAWGEGLVLAWGGRLGEDGIDRPGVATRQAGRGLVDVVGFRLPGLTGDLRAVARGGVSFGRVGGLVLEWFEDGILVVEGPAGVGVVWVGRRGHGILLLFLAPA